jgi:hypothetical protein
VEEIEGKNEGKFKILWDQSSLLHLKDPNNRTKETESGMWRYFSPAWDGLDEFWIDEFGMPVIDKPTPEQFKFLMTIKPAYEDFYKEGGSYTYLVNKRAAKQHDSRASSDEKRLYPFTPEEAFRPSASGCLFNPEHIGRMLEHLYEVLPGGKIQTWERLTRRGDLNWINGIFKGDVRFDPNPNGRFLFSYIPGAHEPDQYGNVLNHVRRGPPRARYKEAFGYVKPHPNHKFVIGTDPIVQDVDHASTKQLSDAAAHGFWMYDPLVDGDRIKNESDPMFGSDWVSHSFVFEYCCRPDLTKTYYEDMLKACIFLGAKLHIENDKPGIIRYFEEAGAMGFMMHRPRSTWGKTAGAQKAVIGTPSSKEMHQRGVEFVAEFVQLHGWARRCPFPKTIKDWLAMDLKNMTKHDLSISSFYTLTGAKPFHVVEKTEEIRTISPYRLYPLNNRNRRYG